MFAATKVTLACILAAAQLQHVPSVLVMALLKTEGGSVGGWTTNQDGSHDLGPMQVNDRTWVPRIAKMQFRGNKEAAARELIYDGCYNVEVGTYIFSLYLGEAKGNYGEAVGYYNSHTPVFANNYRRRFLRSLDNLIEDSQKQD